MARAKQVKDSPAKVQQTHDIWATYGPQEVYTLADWDPDTAAFCQALLNLAAQGEQVTFKRGSGGKSLGVQVWTFENRREWVWFHEHEELDTWANWVNTVAEGLKPKPVDE